MKNRSDQIQVELFVLVVFNEHKNVCVCVACPKKFFFFFFFRLSVFCHFDLIFSLTFEKEKKTN